MESFIEILKIILPACITGIFTFIATKYNYNKNVPLDNMKIAYNRIYYPLYKIINSNNGYNRENIDVIINNISAYINDYNIKYIDRSTYKSYRILKDNPNKYNYDNFKNNIYDKNSYLRRRLGYLEPSFIQSVKYLSKGDKFIFYFAICGIFTYILLIIATFISKEESTYYFIAAFSIILLIFDLIIYICGLIYIGFVKLLNFFKIKRTKQ